MNFELKSFVVGTYFNRNSGTGLFKITSTIYRILKLADVFLFCTELMNINFVSFNANTSNVGLQWWRHTITESCRTWHISMAAVSC